MFPRYVIYKKLFILKSVVANNLEVSFELPLNFPLLTEFTLLPFWAKTINQNFRKVKGDKEVNSYKKRLLFLLKYYDTVYGSSRLSDQ